MLVGLAGWLGVKVSHYEEEIITGLDLIIDPADHCLYLMQSNVILWDRVMEMRIN